MLEPVFGSQIFGSKEAMSKTEYLHYLGFDSLAEFAACTRGIFEVQAPGGHRVYVYLGDKVRFYTLEIIIDYIQ